jgi:hypothetical protein
MDFFKINKKNVMLGALQCRNFFTWKDDVYRDFMISLLLNLEPYVESKNV